MNKARLRRKAIFSAAFLLSLLLLPQAVIAEPLRAGWVLQEGSAPPTWIFGDNEAVIMLSTNEPGGKFDASAAMQKFDVPELCPGISKMALSAPDPDNVRIARMSSDTFDCAIGSRTGTQSSVTFVVLQISGSKADAINYAKSIAWQALGVETVAKNQSKNATIRSGAPMASDVELKRMIDAVPTANRPIGWIVSYSGQMMGSVWRTFSDSWMIFANGYATNCYHWNPAKTSPTPQSGIDTESCELARWTKTGDKYSLGNKDGSWRDPAPLEKNTLFRVGQKLDFELESVDGALTLATNGMAWGGIEEADLRLLPTGRFTFGSNKHSRHVYNETDRQIVDAGSYFVNGHLMATKSDNGPSALHFVGAYSDDMMLMNDKIFSPDRTQR